MTESYPDTLTLSRKVLRVLTKLNLLMGALILALLIASLVAESWVMRALGARPAPGNSMLFLGMRLIMVIGICSVPIVHLILARLLTIVETVSVGNPFVMANAVRLKTIAWAILGLELIDFTVGAIAAGVSTAAAPLNISSGFSLTRWLTVLLLFVLARVFEQGARMREISKVRSDHADHREGGRDASRASNDAHGAVRENRNHARQPVDPEDRKGARRPILHARGHLRSATVPAS